MRLFPMALILVPVMLGWPRGAAQTEPTDKLPTEQRKELLRQGTELNAQAVRLFRAGKPEKALESFRQSLKITQRLYPKAEYPDGHPDLAGCLSNMGHVLEAMGEYEKALTFCQQALAMDKRLHQGNDHPHVANGLNNVGHLLKKMGKYEKALPFYEDALAMHKRLHQDQDHPLVARSLQHLGTLLHAMREYEKALSFEQQALKMFKRLHESKDHPDLATSLNNMGALLRAMGEPKKAVPFYTDALAMTKRLHQDQDHPDVATSLNNMGYLLTSLGDYEKAQGFFRDALAMHQRLYEGKDHPDLATCLNNMGYLLIRMGEYQKAKPYYQDALDMSKRLHQGNDHPHLATCLNNMGNLFEAMGKHEKALSFYSDALAMFRRLSPNRDHPDVAVCLNNVGNLHKSMGEYDKALSFHQKALAMRKRLYPGKVHSEVATSLNNMGTLLRAMGEYEKALPFHQDALAMYRQLHRDQDHRDLATCLNGMGTLLHMIGEHDKALAFCEDALKMRKRLYKGQDHPDLATSLNNMGSLLREMGEYEKALAFFEAVLTMDKRFYPERDHPHLATSLNNIAEVLALMEENEKALSFFTDALAMRRRLYPDQDHPDLASSLNSMGGFLQGMEEYQKALPFYQDALAILKPLYQGKDHPHLATSLHNMGSLLQEMGEYEKALPFCTDALRMQQRYTEREAAWAPLAEGLALIRSLPDVRSTLLSVSQRVADHRDDVFETIWMTKSALAHLLRTRHRLAHLSRSQSENVRENVTNLRHYRRRLTALLQQPAAPQRDQALRELNDRIEQLERALAKVVYPDRLFAKRKLADLAKALKDGHVFIDLYRYSDGLARKPDHPYCYVAFILTSEGKPKRVELGPAQRIEAAVTAWRKALVKQTAHEHGRSVRQLLWEPIEQQLPANTQAIYLCPDEDLGRIPFAALPAANPKQILLEQYAIALVPSGPFLLEQLTGSNPSVDQAQTVLLTGGIDYGPGEGPNWPYLNGTAREIAQIRELVNDRPIVARQGKGATAEWLLKHLPHANVAHIATHGEFRAEEYSQEQIRFEKTRQDRLSGLSATMQASTQPQADSLIAGAGVRNPLGYVGLVMAEANTSETGIASGLDILDLDLSNMQLAVLSACETGLGEHTGAAGVQNLQLAFHVAGCDNVIASLWKVDDDATAALMAKFYHELWVKKKPPIEALRQAQLTIYHHPERINSLARERGIKFDKVVQLPVRKDNANVEARGKTHPKLWAAFVLSGTGK